MAIDSQAVFFFFMCLVLGSYFISWFVTQKPRDSMSALDRALMYLIGWLIIGWFPMGILGFLVGLVMGYFEGTLNEYTTGGLLTGMALYIPVGVIAYHIHLKRL